MRSAVATLLAGAALLLVVAGTTGCASGQMAGAGGDGCIGGPTRPVSRERAAKALRHEGFTVTVSTSGQVCELAGPDAAFAISNAPRGGPTAYNQVQIEQGIVFCTLYSKPVFGAGFHTDLHEPPSSPIFHGRKARFWFKNLECLLYPGDVNADRKVTRLSRATKRVYAP